MIEAIPQALSLIFTVEGMFVLTLGTMLGIVLGALPGIGSTVAVAMILPFTLTMTQAPAILLLLAIYAGSVYGGSISAILINTPGTPQSAATCLDGYPMAQRGEAGKALGWATIASVVGGLTSAVVLIFAAPQLAAFALNFGPIETFALILLGLTCIVSVSEGSMIKGLIAGFLGLFLSTVGGDPLTGEARFTFGNFQLIAGFNLLAVVIGVFALSEVLIRASAISDADNKLVKFSGIVLPKLSEWSGRVKGLIKSVLIGNVIGILPGTGAATAAFISYAEARRSAPTRDNFGKGEPDGLIASESANNAVTGGALVPTMALGIPGDAITAVMLATLTLHGVTPGVRLMSENPVLMAAIFSGFFIINLMLLPFGMIVSRLAAPILRIKEAYMLVMISLLCTVGVFFVRGNPFDLLVMALAGIFGFVLRRQGFPMAPLVIGMVLGPTLEISLRQGLIITDGSFAAFFTGHPIAAVLAVIALVMLTLPVIRFYRSKSAKA
ncbi:tripartite tricarboxylate transporter permease [Yoonia sediminilitoris]|uniref:Putative tricarboxylic transport membrane protein n=1 Tax=Yoonia sediminilitoris TaxID=1286148 RepID=A0A2T6KDG0_9RHOB|nr:tripartite tricarboxylate transporter permease [Yoonia sediminilitoris]PUB13084.1 putative tricarboxylic transport membrane protein [Yoonia sediminilitoris]RCW94421.1 putative tricarboxylic transport membrane protein [Yoonia sediminilitoris]